MGTHVNRVFALLATGAALAEGTKLSEDLLGFWVSEGALAVRRRLGLL